MRKIKKLLQKIFKVFFQLIFKLVYGKIIYKKDNLISNNIIIDQVANKNIVNFLKKKYQVYKIKNGRIYTDNVENVALIDKNIIIDNISYQQILGNLMSADKNICIKKGTPRIKKRFKGRVLSLAQGASGNSNYFHWLFDLLPKIKLYSEIYNLKDLDYLYSGKLKNWQKQSLSSLGLDKINVIDIQKYRHIEADEIICTDHPSYYSGYIEEQSQNIPIWIIDWLRETFLESAKKFPCNNKIFIDRSSASTAHCQFINDEEISEFLIRKGFTKYKVEELNFFEEVYLFKNSNYIIGAHGAGLANLVFCKKGTKVIEIRPKNHLNSLYGKLSKINNLDYNLLSTNIIEDSNKSEGDIYLDIKELNNFFI
ncbi:glycosyltransferase family 61 protein [Pelagibacteraceae bacterium]|jgi:capsular polysaccharide biosynthesis protein|nr:glycosyltransferase family 61 protein [Pelagibacteraceae bacterium]